MLKHGPVESEHLDEASHFDETSHFIVYQAMMKTPPLIDHHNAIKSVHNMSK